MNIEYRNDIIQGSDEWHAIRLGRFTSSKTYTLMKEPSKATRAKEALWQIKNTNILDSIMIHSEEVFAKRDLTYTENLLKENFPDLVEFFEGNFQYPIFDYRYYRI